jgi:thiosulfate/3-mercaptopyruvate sulfurtransferase
MQCRGLVRVIFLVFGAAIILWSAAPNGFAQFSNPADSPRSAASIPDSALMQPEALLRLLRAGGADTPLVLQVVSRIFFAEAHISGAEFAGPGTQPAGLQLLQSKVAAEKKGRPIVIYCGCCPWNHCPNVGPAYKQLRDLGFTNVKVLYLANNFGDDWVAKGYAVEHGQ